MKKIFYIGLLLACNYSCEDEDTEPLSEDFFFYQYFPLQVGQEHVYQIDSIIYDDFSGSVDTFRHQRREVVEGTFLDNEAREAYIIGIYRRLDSSFNWNKQEEIYRSGNSLRIEEFNNNLRKVRMVFPITERKSWDANAFNIEDKEEYTYTVIHQPLELNELFYDSTLTIVQRDEKNFIEEFFSEEKYATQFGLIYRKDIEIRTNFAGEIQSGYNASIQLIDFKAGE